MSEPYQYDVALSFAGEDRAYVQMVADNLTSRNVQVFYDEYEKATLWGKNLYEHLTDVYQNRAQYTVIFISRYYKAKVWTNQERRAAQARALTENNEYILPVRFDDTEIEGILPTQSYLDLRKHSPAEVSVLICEKLGKGLFVTKAYQTPSPKSPAKEGVVDSTGERNGLCQCISRGAVGEGLTGSGV
jgi:hypothetical protein